MSQSNSSAGKYHLTFWWEHEENGGIFISSIEHISTCPIDIEVHVLFRDDK